MSDKTPTPNAPGDAGPMRVLHLSDLHFGWRFEQSNWQQLRRTARDLRPDLVLVTGDLVNTPWFWMLPKARKALEVLRAELSPLAASGRCEVWALPGNHDTKISGVLPLGWLLPIALACLPIALALAWLGFHVAPLPGWLAWTFRALAMLPATLTVLGVLLRLLVRRDLLKAFGADMWLTQPRLTANGRVGVMPLDSATHDTSWARGHVPAEELAAMTQALEQLRKATREGRSAPMWMAAVHHHVLPLPYDSANEQMMVMGNAGAVLSELANLRIRLVLHGHKHHQHFSRVVIDSARQASADIAVLSAGTPTEARNAGAFWHGFNLIEIGEDGNARVDMYQGPPGGGAFRREQTFDLNTTENQDRWRHEEDWSNMDVRCERLVCSVEINQYGDARFFREYIDVSTPLETLKALPGTFVAEAHTGLMEAYTARGMSSHGPRVRAVPVSTPQRTANRIEVTLRFEGAGLLKHDQPIDFLTEVYGNNAFALNQWQFDCMYPDNQEATEDISFCVPEGMAVRELILQATFPADMRLPRRISPRVRHRGAAPDEWSWLPNEELVWLNLRNTVHMRIPYPRPGSTYQLNWDLQDNIYGEGNPVRERGIERALGLRQWLDTLTPQNLPASLLQVLAAIELNARQVLGDGAHTQPLDLAFFAFDAKDKCLHYLAGTHADKDARRQACYKFGLGLPGRAFKAGQAVSFRRPPFTPGERPWGYVLPDGRPVESGGDVPEVAILAIALSPVEAPDWPYAVLQLSTDDTTTTLRTTDTPQGMNIKDYTYALRLQITEALEKTYDQTHHV